MIEIFNQANISKHPTYKLKFESIKILNSPKFVFNAHPECSLFIIFVVLGTTLIASLDFIHKTYNILFWSECLWGSAWMGTHLVLRELTKDWEKSSTPSRTPHCLHVLPLIPQTLINFGWTSKTRWWQFISCLAVSFQKQVQLQLTENWTYGGLTK